MVERYNASDTSEGRQKEQQRIDDHGGVKELDSKRMKSNQLLGEFWKWFADNASAIASEKQPQLLDLLDHKLHQVNPRLSWEIGPGRLEPWLLAISPNLDREVAEDAKEVVAVAPEVPGWEFYATRQPKQWDYRVELEGGGRYSQPE